MGTAAIMGRMHAPGKGISQSALPYRRSVPTWLKLSSDDVTEQIFKLAKKGLTPSQIGVILRDSHGVAQVRFVTGNKVLYFEEEGIGSPTARRSLFLDQEGCCHP